MVNELRLCEEFQRQAAIDSPSFEEAAIAAYLQTRLEKLGAQVYFDRAGEAIGSSSGNLIARLPGTIAGPPLLLSAHMDTVTPAANVQPVLKDGIFSSVGETILGADDKAGICEIIEAITILKEQQSDHVPLEIVITVCEEQGLLGVKQLDTSGLQARQGVALDTAGRDLVINQAPAANRFQIDILGLEAHAGICPEEGISAIEIAGRAIASMRLGRIDHETTANIGTIHGGEATNIVAGRVSLRGEVRSHSSAKLKEQTGAIIRAVEEEIEQINEGSSDPARKASLQLELNEDFPAFAVSENAPIVKLVTLAGAALDRPQTLRAAGGGSDANIFNARGIEMVILATGMKDIHSVNEQIAVADMVKTTELLVEIIRKAG